MIGGWDTAVALAYAAEELHFAAQALSGHLMPQEHNVSAAHRHVHDLLQHERYLPSEIGIRLRNLEALYAECESSPGTGASRRHSATEATMAVLSDVRDLLHENENRHV